MKWVTGLLDQLNPASLWLKLGLASVIGSIILGLWVAVLSKDAALTTKKMEAAASESRATQARSQAALNEEALDLADATQGRELWLTQEAASAERRIQARPGNAQSIDPGVAADWADSIDRLREEAASHYANRPDDTGEGRAETPVPAP